MERRLAAIVAADVVDYSRLLAADQAATLAALDEVRIAVIEPALAGTSGRIFRLLGDSALFAFDSVLEAVQFAIKLQRGNLGLNKSTSGGHAIAYRIGVNLGDIVESGGEFHGEGINIAVRLEAIAPPGGICISQAVQSQISTHLGTEFRPLGPRQLKNISGPVEVWRWPQEDAERDAAGRTGTAPATPSGHAGGQQILDPKVSRLLVLLHMRSARLALSETLDEILAEPAAGRGLDLGQLYSRLGDRLNHARALLSSVNVHCIDNISDYSGGKWAPQMPMSEFIAGVFDSSDTSYAMKLLPLIKEEFDSDNSPHQKRLSLMRLFDNFMTAEMLPRTTLLMKYAFVDL